jgi:hypothetical protein
MFRNNLVFAYVALVGLPLLVLLGVLNVGKNLTTSPSIAGNWVVEFDQATPTVATFRDLTQPVLMIAQSGPNLTITLNNARKTEFFGAFRDVTIVTAMSHPLAEATCDLPARLELHVHGRPKQRSFDGRFFFEGCARWTQIGFHAVRLNSSRKQV